MTHWRTIVGGAAAVALALGGAAPASAKDEPKSPLIGALAQCRAMTDPAQRLACFDQTSGALIAATESGAVSVVDRGQLRQARRSLFGFAMPRLPFFSGDKSAEDDKGELDSTIIWWRAIGHGRYQLRIADGNAMWETLETSISQTDPRKGQKIVIKRGPLGSYILRLEGQRGVKGKRIG